MQNKSDKIRQMLADGETRKAVSVASMFFDRSAETQLYKQAQAAINNPSFYRQIGKDPDAIFAAAVDALNHRFPPQA
jgi:hypothetical protein